MAYRRSVFTVPRSLALAAALAAVLLIPGDFDSPAVSAQAVDPCAGPSVNPIACENSKTGNPASEWDISGSGSSSIQGFATDISVNKGGTIGFKVATPATSYPERLRRCCRRRRCPRPSRPA
jgi:hypothetical protein